MHATFVVKYNGKLYNVHNILSLFYDFDFDFDLVFLKNTD